MKNEVFNIRMINTTDDDYPLIMRGLPNKEKYTLLGINDAVFVPLYQVIDEIIGIKANIIKRNGVECCPTCMKPFTPQQKVGEWIGGSLCNRCNYKKMPLWQYDYCPKCGAKMEEIEE